MFVGNDIEAVKQQEIGNSQTLSGEVPRRRRSNEGAFRRQQSRYGEEGQESPRVQI